MMINIVASKNMTKSNGSKCDSISILNFTFAIISSTVNCNATTTTLVINNESTNTKEFTGNKNVLKCAGELISCNTFIVDKRIAIKIMTNTNSTGKINAI